MLFFYVKALHIIFIVTWFAGLFYIVRLFIYYAEAEEQAEPEKSILQKNFKLHQKRLWYGITWPSAVLTAIFGPSLWYLYNSLPDWLFIKLVFVALLYLYHILCHFIFKQQQLGVVKYNSMLLRIWNEVATIFLFAIVFIVVVKSALSMVYGIVGLVLFAFILLLSIRVYKKLRDKNKN